MVIRPKSRQTPTTDAGKAKAGTPLKPLGQWLVENMPRGIDLEIPDRREPERPIPFVDEPAA